MTTLDERLHAAADAIGDAPRHGPPFESLHRRRRRRQRATAVVAATLSIVLVCAVAIVAVRRDGARPARPAGDTSTSTGASTTRTTLSASGVPSLASMPKLPASTVHTVALSRSVGAGTAVFANGSLWTIAVKSGCESLPDCGSLVRIDPATGVVATVAAHPFDSQAASPLAVGDGAAFVTTYDYAGAPAKLLAIDLVTGRRRFSVPVPGTSVQGNPKFRISVGAGAVWVSEGSLPVTEFDAHTGALVARIPLPQDGAETSGTIGTAFDRFGVWLVGGSSGTTVMLVDPVTHAASIVLGYGAGFSQSLAADDARVWTTHFAGKPARLDLARIDLDHPARISTGIPTAEVADGGGEVWFAGYAPGTQAADPRNRYGVIGRIDPITMKVTGVAELPAIGELTEVDLFADSGGAWVYLPGEGTISRIRDPLN